MQMQMQMQQMQMQMQQMQMLMQLNRKQQVWPGIHTISIELAGRAGHSNFCFACRWNRAGA